MLSQIKSNQRFNSFIELTFLENITSITALALGNPKRLKFLVCDKNGNRFFVKKLSKTYGIRELAAYESVSDILGNIVPNAVKYCNGYLYYPFIGSSIELTRADYVLSDLAIDWKEKFELIFSNLACLHSSKIKSNLNYYPTFYKSQSNQILVRDYLSVVKKIGNLKTLVGQIHGDFHLKNVLLPQRHIYFIDFGHYNRCENIFLDYVKLEGSLLFHLFDKNSVDFLEKYSFLEIYRQSFFETHDQKRNHVMIAYLRKHLMKFARENGLSDTEIELNYAICQMFFMTRFVLNEENSDKNKIFAALALQAIKSNLLHKLVSRSHCE